MARRPLPNRASVAGSGVGVAVTMNSCVPNLVTSEMMLKPLELKVGELFAAASK
jgi:hypothetical protein